MLSDLFDYKLTIIFSWKLFANQIFMGYIEVNQHNLKIWADHQFIIGS